MGVSQLQTKLDKVKSFMDNGTFLFTFNRTRPFAIHESQLFKNQLADEVMDEYGVIHTVPKIDTELKRERVKSIVSDANGGFGILFDSGRLSIPNRLFVDDQFGYTVIEVPDITYQINSKTLVSKDKIKSFAFFKDPEGTYFCLYVVTQLQKMYYIDLSEMQLNTETNKYEPSEFKQVNILENDRPVNIFSGSNSIYVQMSNNSIYCAGNSKYDVLKVDIGEYPESCVGKGESFYPTTFILSGLVPFNFNTVEGQKVYDTEDPLDRIYTQYNRTFFIYKSGYAKVIGKGNLGCLGTGSSNDKNELVDLGCDMEPGELTVNDIASLRYNHIKDIAIGENHTIILFENGLCYGFGSNEHYELGAGDEANSYVNKYRVITFPDKVSSVTTTKYGTVAISAGKKIMYTGTFLNYELGMLTESVIEYERMQVINPDGTVSWKLNYDKPITETAKITIDGVEYTQFLQSSKPVRIMRTLDTDVTNNLISFLYEKIYNTHLNGVLVLREDGKIYYTGENTLRIVGNSFGDNNVSVWTALENPSNDLGRIVEDRPTSWTYFDTIVRQADKLHGLGYKNCFYKTHNGKWIDWDRFITASHTGGDLEDPRNPSGPKLKAFVETELSDGSKVRKMNWESYEIYASQETFERNYGISKRALPEVIFIDANLNSYHINQGDNFGFTIYTQEDAEFYNEPYQGQIDQLTDEILDLTDKMDELEQNDPLYTQYLKSKNEKFTTIDELKQLITINNNKVGKAIKERFDFNENIRFDPSEYYGTEKKTVTYNGRILDEDDITCYPKDETGKEVMDIKKNNRQISKTQTVDSIITRVQIELFDKYNESLNLNQPNKPLRDDIKLKMNDVEVTNYAKNYDFTQFLIWLNGTFPIHDIMDDKNKVTSISNGLSIVPAINVCGNPYLGEPKVSTTATPAIKPNGTATIKSTKYPTEFRWDFKLRMFGWEGVTVEGPINISDTKYFAASTIQKKKFYFGDWYVTVPINIYVDKAFAKDEFLLMMNGVVISENEFDIEEVYDNYETRVGTRIILTTFWDYVGKLLVDTVKLSKPGAYGYLKSIAEMIENNQFTVCFFKSDQKFKKIRLYRDRQCIRNVPYPKQVLFSDIKYNDLVLVDGHYIPFTWENSHAIEFHDTINSLHDSENDFINTSDIYRLLPYTIYKDEDELTDYEIREFVSVVLGKNDEFINSQTIHTLRSMVAQEIEKMS